MEKNTGVMKMLAVFDEKRVRLLHEINFLKTVMGWAMMVLIMAWVFWAAPLNAAQEAGDSGEALVDVIVAFVYNDIVLLSAFYTMFKPYKLKINEREFAFEKKEK